MKYVDSIKECILLYIATIFVSSILYSIVEHKDLFESVWWSCVTAMTVGYGDMYPTTFLGKLIALVLMHFSILFILPLTIGNICSTLVKDKNEFTHEEQEEIKKLLKDIKELKNL